MKLTPKIATAAVAVVALGGGGIATAVASSASTRAPAHQRAAHSEPATPDTDNIQQGDQTTPDNPAAAVRGGTAHSVRSLRTHAVRTHAVKADPSGETSSEGDSSDGPGGHADPAGDVQHEFSGVE